MCTPGWHRSVLWEWPWSGNGVCHRSGIGVHRKYAVYVCWWVIWLSSRSGILVYTYDILSMVGGYTPVGVITEWLWSVHSKLDYTLRRGKGIQCKRVLVFHDEWFLPVPTECSNIIWYEIIWHHDIIYSYFYKMYWTRDNKTNMNCTTSAYLGHTCSVFGQSLLAVADRRSTWYFYGALGYQWLISPSCKTQNLLCCLHRNCR